MIFNKLLNKEVQVLGRNYNIWFKTSKTTTKIILAKLDISYIYIMYITKVIIKINIILYCKLNKNKNEIKTKLK